MVPVERRAVQGAGVLPHFVGTDRQIPVDCLAAGPLLNELELNTRVLLTLGAVEDAGVDLFPNRGRSRISANLNLRITAIADALVIERGPP